MSPGTSVDTTSDVERSALRASRRRDRYEAQRVVWRETNLRSGRTYVDRHGNERQSSRLANCGRYVADNTAGVTVKVTRTADGAVGGFSGLQTCGSVWSCPVCSEKINAARQAELTAAVVAWIALGNSLVFGTLTMRHNKRHRLGELWDAISPAWNRTTSGAGVAWNGSKRPGGDMGDRARFGIAGYTRVVEVKHGPNGWHPHIHFLLFIEGPDLTDSARSDLSRRMFGRWESALARQGFSVLQSVGIDLRAVTSGDGIADYLAKSTYGTTTAGAAAYEVTGSQSKTAGKGGLSPFQVLERLVEHGDADDLDLWHEWEVASQGRRQLTWSRGMRDRLGLDVEATDEELADADDLDGDEEVTIPTRQWNDGGWAARRLDLLEAVEQSTYALFCVLEDDRASRAPIPRLVR